MKRGPWLRWGRVSPDEQKVFILKQGAEGTAVAGICRKAGIRHATCFNWKKRYGGVLSAEMRRLTTLEVEEDWETIQWTVFPTNGMHG